MILAKTGPRDPPVFTPSVCSYILPLKEKVSKINFFKELFVSVFVISLPVEMYFKTMSTVFFSGTLVKRV